jgi:hypothetical protein
MRGLGNLCTFLLAHASLDEAAMKANLYAAVIVLLLGFASGWAQPVPQPNQTLTGTVSTFSELYSIDGREARRPYQTGRLMLRPTVSFSGIQIPLEIMLSTEESGDRQSFNRFAATPTWKWGKFYIGDFYPQFSPFTLNGITVRGGGVDLRPGIFRFSAASGQSQRATESIYSMGTYSRNLWAVKVGVGREMGTFFDINVLRVQDDMGSVTDSIAAAPQENMIVGINGQFSFMKNKFYLRYDAAGSIHTRDMNSSEVEDEAIPEFLTKIYTPRLSSKADYSFEVQTGVRMRRYDAQLGVSRIGPGFTSLGTYSTVNDRLKYSVRSNIHIIPRKVSVRGQYIQYNDNLLGQNKTTTKRETHSYRLNLRPAGVISFELGYSRNTMGNDSKYDTTRIETYNGRYSVSTRLQTKIFNMPQSIQFAYELQESERKNPLRATSGYDVNNYMVILQSAWLRNFSVQPQFGLTTNRMFDGTVVNIYQYGFGVNHSAWKNKLTNNVRFLWRSTEENVSAGIYISTRFRVSRSDFVIFNLRHMDYSFEIDPEMNFRERVMSLQLDHRF